uniref:fimbrial biogenesis chaperone n=1 Tax=Hafnia alvei TaxID=569 RepID=UPI00242EC2B9|nr:molecular chaperone [Hafnia alvei]
MINKTRIIYDEKFKNANVTLSNTTDGNYAVQVWMNNEIEHLDDKTPFIATPSLFRLDPGQEQIVKIIRLPGGLPNDRESIFYFNAQEIPEATKSNERNKLVMAIRTRIKLIYRPNGILTKSEKAPELLQWKKFNTQNSSILQVSNTTPFYITFLKMKWHNGNEISNIHDPLMLPPFSMKSYLLKDKTSNVKGFIDYEVINDFGGITHYKNIKVI